MDIKREIRVPYLVHSNRNSGFEQLVANLASIEGHAIDKINWNEFDYRPEVHFKIAYTKDSLVLLYDIWEDQVKAVYDQINDPVYRDSCVEFFLSFDGIYYYNFEFNCIGTVLVAHGNADKQTRQFLPPDLIGEMKINTQISKHKQNSYWQLMANIPFALFINDNMENFSMKGKTCFANFYKCGDDLKQPHYLSWNKIRSASPNFHLPDYFGKLQFD